MYRIVHVVQSRYSTSEVVGRADRACFRTRLRDKYTCIPDLTVRYM